MRYKTIADSGSNIRFRVSMRSDVVAEDLESLSIQLANPALDQKVPDRMLMKKGADDPDLYWLFSRRRLR